MNLRKLLSMLTVMAALPCALCGCIQQAVTGSPEITGTVEILPTPTATVRVDEINGIFVDAINGSDAGDGSRKAPFASVEKAMEKAGPGKTMYLADGVYYGTLKPVNGTEGQPFTVSALPGCKPVLTPTVPVTGFTRWKDSIYVADVSDIADSIDAERAQLFADTESLTEARWPNSGKSLRSIMEAPRALAGEGTDAETIVTPEAMPEGIVGAKAVVWPGENGVAGWICYTSRIKSAQGCVLKLEDRLDTPENYIGMNAYSPVKGNPFFLTGALCLLDAPGEYWYDAENKKVYVYMPEGDDPSAHTITMRGSSKAVQAKDARFINLQGLSFYGGGITLPEAEDCRIENCRVLFSDHFYASGYASYVLKSSNHITGKRNLITRCEFGYSAFNGITLGGEDNVFTDNIVHHSNYCGDDFAGLYVLKSSRCEISRNNITYSGRVHIYFTINTDYDACVIRGNYLYGHSRLTSDSGAFYTWSCNGGGTRLYNNFVDCGEKTENGTMSKCWDGLYLDNYCSNFTVDHNIVVGGTCGLRTNLSNENTLYANNTVIGSQYGYGIYSYPKDDAKTGKTRFYNNLFVALKGVDINYSGSENGQSVVYTGALKDGTVPCPVNPEQRIESGSNLRVSYIIENEGYQPADGSPAIDAGCVIEGITDGYLGDAPDIGAIEKGGKLFEYGATWSLEA